MLAVRMTRIPASHTAVCIAVARTVAARTAVARTAAAEHTEAVAVPCFAAEGAVAAAVLRGSAVGSQIHYFRWLVLDPVKASTLGVRGHQ